MYLNRRGQLFGAGHESAGVTAPATSWFLAEGATGTFFDLFILIANPNARGGGGDRRRTCCRTARLLPKALRRRAQQPLQHLGRYSRRARLADTAVSTTITSTNGVRLIVERAMWWPGPTPTNWFEAHNSPGATTTGTRWALAEGEVGGANATETYVLLPTRPPFAGSARVTLLFEDGTTADDSRSRSRPTAGSTSTCGASSRRRERPAVRGHRRERGRDARADRRRARDVFQLRRHGVGGGHQRRGHEASVAALLAYSRPCRRRAGGAV